MDAGMGAEDRVYFSLKLGRHIQAGRHNNVDHVRDLLQVAIVRAMMLQRRERNEFATC